MKTTCPTATEMQRNALITGFTRGIGKAIAFNLAKQGFRLVLIYKNSDDLAKSVGEELSKLTQTLVIKCDVSDTKQIENACERAKEEFGFIDTLINNAGISRFAFFDNETQESYDEVMNTNFRSVFTFCNILCKDMISNKFGRIVNISSVWGKKPASIEVLYSASKSAVLGLTRSLNSELAPSGILVNAVCPGVIDTDMNAHFSQDDKQAIIDEIPLTRMGKAEEGASVVELLTREELYIGGEEITVSSGF